MELLASRDVDKIDTDLSIYSSVHLLERKQNMGDMLVYKSEAAAMPPRDVDKIDSNLFVYLFIY